LIGEINIGGLACNGLVFEKPNQLKTPYTIIPTRFYDGMIDHISNGGLTIETDRELKSEEIDYAQEMMIKKLYAFGIKYDQILTNFYFLPSHFDDRIIKRLNLLEEVDGQGVTVSTISVAKHIRKYFPKLIIRWSITGVYRDNPVDLVEYTNRVLEYTDRIVIPPEYNEDWETLAKLPVDKVELMILDQCGSTCKFRKMHYTLSSMDQVRLVNRDIEHTGINRHFCDNIHYRSNVDTRTKDITFVRPTIVKRYMEMGINKFKIASRNFINTMDAPYYLDMILPTLAGEFLVKEDVDLSMYEEEFKQLFKDMKELPKEL